MLIFWQLNGNASNKNNESILKQIEITTRQNESINRQNETVIRQDESTSKQNESINKQNETVTRQDGIFTLIPFHIWLHTYLMEFASHHILLIMVAINLTLKLIGIFFQIYIYIFFLHRSNCQLVDLNVHTRI